MQSVAVIGTGIAGMSCARMLHGQVNLTVFESEPRPGGHTHTVEVEENGAPVPVDTGFMVYNEVTYPRLTRLFEELHVETEPTDMSFSVQHRLLGLEYCGSRPNSLLAQRRNLLRPRFLQMLRDILRFNRRAVLALESGQLTDQTLQAFVQTEGFGQTFLDAYLVPMTSAIWSTPPNEMLDFPAHTLVRFMFNHGLLGVRTHHQWRTVKGGSRHYRDRLIAPFRDRIRCGCPVVAVAREEGGVAVRDASGAVHRFDRVVLATHADTSLQLLTHPTPGESRVLAAFPYAANRITLHSDPAVMPRRRRAWAAWNYRVDPVEGGGSQASTHYWMNALQRVSETTPYFVSVNDPGVVHPDKIHQAFTFDHPMFNKESVEAQFHLPKLNEDGRIYYCGSYFRYGFHEDGLMSGHAAAERLLAHSAAHAQLAV